MGLDYHFNFALGKNRNPLLPVSETAKENQQTENAQTLVFP